MSSANRTARAEMKYARMSAFKIRDIARAMRGLSVKEADARLSFAPQKSARLLLQTLRSAVANGENNHSIPADKLLVHEVMVGEGSTFHRFQPKARGSAGPIRKRTSHIRITLREMSGEQENPAKKEKKGTKAAASSKA
ncbi:MAG: 50S ribosomal protein L22 [Verrucomicrobia bacterium]|nr:50S ribosomal protein L22 [Pseudomonadota bacterium]NBS06246.1 50S ribosomal protein L22 [Verrucomicrobiota bacterium]NBS79337.1 50S ribosomal protein L22 [bacterium]NBS49593.1 50S ribosomal protein L22 [Verrucomicrobiota bacterium]NBT24539.1 50S ribosomal protein L22 [bacterium]